MATSTATTPRMSTWEFDPAHSAAHFSIRHMMVSTVRGQFGKIAGVVKLDETDPTRSSVQATISGSTGIRCSKPAEFSWATTSSSRSTWSW
jgi:polyisoprenoid-binding protein YceI